MYHVGSSSLRQDWLYLNISSRIIFPGAYNTNKLLYLNISGTIILPGTDEGSAPVAAARVLALLAPGANKAGVQSEPPELHFLSIHPFIYLSINMSVCLSIYVSMYLSVYLSIYLSIYVSI